jgi:quercetin dioxygenase-like cupin family protein
MADMLGPMDPAPRVVWMPGGVRTGIHLTGEDTDGAFCLLVDYPPAGWNLPAHRHRGVAETIHVVEGEFEMTVNGQSSHLTPGQSIHVPGDAVHSGGNIGRTPGQRILIFSPAGMERFFLEVGAASASVSADPRAVVDAAIRHGWEFVT